MLIIIHIIHKKVLKSIDILVKFSEFRGYISDISCVVVYVIMYIATPTIKITTNVNLYRFMQNLIEILFQTTECLSYCCKFT